MLNLESCISENNVSVVLATPALWRMISRHNTEEEVGSNRLPSLEQLYLGGEPWSTDSILIPPDLKVLHNMYGVTECTVYQAVSGNLLEGAPVEELYSILGPLAAPALLDFHVLEDSDELCISGTMCLSYLEQPLEAQMDNICLDGDNRSFKSGDRVAGMEPLRILGRIDRQIKLNGFRIELGEIETTITRACSAAFCYLSKKENRLVCWVRRRKCEFEVLTEPKKGSFDFLPQRLREMGEMDPLNQKLCRLLSWDILRNRKKHGNRKWGAAEPLSWVEFTIGLRFFCESCLPRYEIPAKFLCLSVDIPMLSNGKVDRKQLEAWAESGEIPGFAESEMKETCSELTLRETSLGEVWCEILQLDEMAKLEAHSHFFEQGGTSATAVQMIKRLKAHPAFCPGQGVLAAEIQHRRLCGLINQPRLRGFCGFLDREAGLSGNTCSASHDLAQASAIELPASTEPKKKKKIRRKRMDLKSGLQRKTMEMISKHLSAHPDAQETMSEVGVGLDEHIEVEVEVFLMTLRFGDLDLAETFIEAGILEKLPEVPG